MRNQLVTLIRSGMEHLASRPRAKVYTATNRGNPRLAAVKIGEGQSVPGKTFVNPQTMYGNISLEKPSAEAGIGAPSRPIQSTLRRNSARDSCAALKDEHELYRI